MKKKLTWSNIIVLFSLYTTQFLGLGFFLEAFIGILRQNGVSLEHLGFIYMLGLFWVFRFLWAPFIDRIHFKIGHYRIWIIIFQSLMVISIFLISILNINQHLPIILFLAICFAFFASSQNVALDAFAFKITFKRERSLINAIKTAGGLIGMVLGGGVGLILYAKYNWNITLLIMTIVTAISLIQIIFISEPNIKNQIYIDKIDYKQFLTFWKTKQKKLWFILLFLYPATISAAFGLTTPILVDLGWDLDKIGFAVYIIGYGIGFLASFGASYVIKQFGKKNILIVAAILQVIGILMMLLLFNYHHNDILVMFVIGIIFMSYTPSQVLMTTLMMDLSSYKSPASQFAVQHSIYMFSGIFFSSISVSLSGKLGYETMILICSFIGILSIFLSTKIEYIIKKEKNEGN
ncbi:MFS transporter [Aliarcobacter lanthieri]|uniref:MFS transporter n=1 Tax=Aliarcobacter lanthieri TaxID=1355374 RepID=UPI00047DECE6|nr:MFS transporter [Aliarcobacter lanthieri]QKF58520.1 major facilitator superfamily transporter [Aliarcobacter lanthieri]